MKLTFTTRYDEIQARLEVIDPVDYGITRNFVDGSVTRLSPYISRGIISTREVVECVLSRGYQPDQIEKFLQELAWRDYWQQVWIEKGDLINKDLKRPQPEVLHHQMSMALYNANTGIDAIDRAIQGFYSHGYLHNHMRMYTASIACNLSKSHWLLPARWMYYHLLDGDWASNALSWQWVAGANSNKKYYANQDNINKYAHSNQRGTFLDVPYSELEEMSMPEVLTETVMPVLMTNLPVSERIEIDSSVPTLVYNYYNLDPGWHNGEQMNRVLLLEPSIFLKYPVSQKVLDFALALSGNIEGIKIMVGEFHELKELVAEGTLIFKEHPLNLNYQGIEEPRDWMFSVKGYFPSFFTFWKECKKELSI